MTAPRGFRLCAKATGWRHGAYYFWHPQWGSIMTIDPEHRVTLDENQVFCRPVKT
jgi:hypothetical protein